MKSVVPPSIAVPGPATSAIERVVSAPTRQERVVGIGVVGYGYWGPNLVRNFNMTPGARLVAVSDLSQARLADVKAQFPAVRTMTSYDEMLQDQDVHAVAIATPVSTHFRLAMQALEAGKHVLVEKPLAMNSAQAALLVEEAERRGLTLMVDHTFVYHGAVRKIRELVMTGQVGRLHYFDSTRVNLGLFQRDVDVLWDLAVHDLSIMDFVIGEAPRAVAATGAAHVPGQPVNIAYLTCFFEDSLIAHINVNWLAPVKVRRTLIGGDRQMIVYDDLEPSEKVKVYDRGVTVGDGPSGPDGPYEMFVGYRTGDMWAPKVSAAEALSVETQHFVECVAGGHTPLTDGKAGLRIVRILEAATLSLKQGGCPVQL
ncbi:MAG: Gfo/Idh/MocA family protein [Chloroflexota bacterium]